MPALGAARQEAYVPRPTPGELSVGAPASPVTTVAWAVVASTLHRIRRGEGALLAVNLSLIVYQGVDAALAAAQAVVSVLAIVAMYAFNDVHDAPLDWNNPKKDRGLIAAYFHHRRAGVAVAFGLKLLALVRALVTHGPMPTLAHAGVMVVNVVYSCALKGVPVVDVAWVWLWGALYAAVVGGPVPFLVVVGLMTAICHLFQALEDRIPDAASGIRTTAVRSAALSRNLLVVLSLLLVAVLRPMLGDAAALTALTPLAIFFLVRNAGTGWLLTKAYFALMWLAVLGMPGAAG
jgi:4-hydroxybenzoate polyprenyltransferase